MLPAAAYYFARGLRAPWPAPPAFAIAALGMLMETRTDWQIYGGNIASTLAGEFSFTIALALALFGLGALAVTLDTGKRRWLPAVLIAAAIMSHIVVAIFIALAASLLWLTRRPFRTWPLAVAVGGVGAAAHVDLDAPAAREPGVHAEHALHEARPEGELRALVVVAAPRTRAQHGQRIRPRARAAAPTRPRTSI